jgi:hypothetical protein
MLASELAQLSREPLPEIPVEAPRAEPEPQTAAPVAAERQPQTTRRPRAGAPRSSRAGGAVVLGIGATIVLGLIAVLIFVVLGGSPKRNHPARTTAAASSSSASSSTTARVIAQVNLLPPSGGGQAKGIAQVVDVGSTTGIVIYAQGMPANNNNFYAVWLYNSPSDYQIVGYVNPGVGSNGQLQTTGRLPNNATHYNQLLVALQTKAHPKPPGPVVLQGKLALQ